ncbi:TIGR03089 family protein, partial [Dietzia aerolata]|nr:TIGR03089 family protein [Dietzia aerolata]
LDGAPLADLADPALDARVLVPGSDRGDVVSVLARIFASGGTAVLVSGEGSDDDDNAAVTDVAATEKTTHTV